MLEHLRSLREDKDLSQKDMAQLLNVHQTTYSDYELGRLNIPNLILKQLALFFDTSVDYLLGLTNVQKPYPRA
ncbi:MAG: helix-turn-helix transcriptional regulator [Desulfitobacterium hafniense]